MWWMLGVGLGVLYCVVLVVLWACVSVGAEADAPMERAEEARRLQSGLVRRMRRRRRPPSIDTLVLLPAVQVAGVVVVVLLLAGVGWAVWAVVGMLW